MIGWSPPPTCGLFGAGANANQTRTAHLFTFTDELEPNLFECTSENPQSFIDYIECVTDDELAGAMTGELQCINEINCTYRSSQEASYLYNIFFN